MNSEQTSIISLQFTAPESDIVIAKLKKAIGLDLKIAEEIVAERLAFTENKYHYLVADVSQVQSITTEAKKYLQQPERGLKNILGAALIASNPLSALIANIFIKTPTQFKSRFFSNEEDAIAWIIEQREKKLKSN